MVPRPGATPTARRMGLASACLLSLSLGLAAVVGDDSPVYRCESRLRGLKPAGEARAFNRRVQLARKRVELMDTRPSCAPGHSAACSWSVCACRLLHAPRSCGYQSAGGAARTDRSLRPITAFLQDGFGEAGIGWGNTITNNLPVHRIDQIWISQGLRALAVSARRTRHSDHRMVVCDIAPVGRSGFAVDSAGFAR